MHEDNVIGFFSLKGRTGRWEFAKIYLMSFLFGFVNLFFLPLATNEYAIGFIIIYCLVLLALWPITVRRLHDSNLNGTYYLISLVPSLLNYMGMFVVSEVSFLLAFIAAFMGIYFLYLIFRRGNAYSNNYGAPNTPKRYSNRTINGICVLLFIFIIVSGLLYCM